MTIMPLETQPTK